MQVMVTGGSGFLGSHTVLALQEAGHDVRLLLRSAARAEQAFAGLGSDLPDHVIGDVTDTRSVLEALDGCDAVVHTAAVVEASPSDEAAMMKINVGGTRTVLHSAAEVGCDPIVHVSSSAALFPFAGSTVTTDDPVGQMTGGYGRSKAQAETIARDMQAQDMPVNIIYPTGIVGPGASQRNEQVDAMVFLLAKSAPRNDDLKMAMVDVRDCADMVVALMEPGRGPRRYLAWGHLLTMTEIAEVLCEITGKEVRSPRLPTSLMRVWGTAGDMAKRFGMNLTLTSEGFRYLADFADGDQRATTEDLGISFRPTASTLSDLYRWAHREGLLSADQVGMLAT
jgi:nucleoside-diphosphate-sugar epimerase